MKMDNGYSPRRAFGAGTTAALAMLFTLCLLSLPGCRKPAAAETSEAKPVRAAAVEERMFTPRVEYSARVLAAKEVAVTPKVGGRVESVRAGVGDRVVKGQILFTIDSSDFQAQYRQAEAAYDSAAANLTRTTDAGQSQQMLQAQAGVDQAQVAYDETNSLRDKTKNLFDAGAVAKQDLDDVEAKLKSAGIQLDTARQSLALVRDKAGKQAGDVASGQVNQAKAQTDLAKSQLDGAVIRSPISGLVSYRNVESGVFVGTSSVTFVVIDDSSMIADVAVSQLVTAMVRPGMKVPAHFGPPVNGDFESVVEWVSPGVDPRTMLYSIRLRFPVTGREIKPGMIARLSLPAGEGGSVLMVPERAIVPAIGGDAAYVAAGGKATLRRVELGDSDGSSVAVLSGLNKGDMVITEGQEFLRDGETVRVGE